MPHSNLDILWVLLCAGLVFLMQAGFVCLETGLTRAKNSINVAIKNLSDFTLSVTLYWVFGFTLMFGISGSGLWGNTTWFFNPSENINSFLAFFLFQAMFCATAATIVSGAVAERMKFKAYLLTTFLISGFLYPLFGHWAWGGIIENHGLGWLKKVGFIDFAGSTVVHSLGGWMSLAVIVIIGARQGRFNSNQYNDKIKRSNIPLSVLGVLLLWLGWFGFNGGSTFSVKSNIALIIANTVLAGASGGLLALAVNWLSKKRPEVTSIMNGSLAGLVAITASCYAVTTTTSVIIGAIGGFVMLSFSRILEKLRIDDAVDAVPVHLGGGIWGTLAVAIFADLDILGTGLNRWQQLQVQALGITICGIWVLSGGGLILYLTNKWLPLRVSPEKEKLGLNYTEHGESTEMYTLLSSMEEQAKSGDISQKVEIEPFTEAGEVAQRYNKILETLHEAEKNNQLIIENSLDAIVSMNEEGVITAWNTQAEKIFGWSAQEAIGSKLTENIIPERFREAHDKGLKRFLQSGEGPVLNKRFEIHAKNKRGFEFPIELAITPLKTSKGYFFSAFIRDITERTEFENNLKAAKDAAEATSVAKSQFLANMSHEIRTPMNGIMGMLQLALNTELKPQQKEYLELAHNSAKSLLVIINDILDFSRIETGKIELNQTQFKVKELIEQVIKLISVNAQEKALEVHTEISNKISPLLIGDPARLQQILLNLLSNAIKFTKSGKITLKVALEKQTEEIEELYFSIQDTGTGIPKDKIRDIFSAFSQVDSSHSRKYGGTGLGLAICFELLKQMKGKIWVESEVDKGSNFQFFLPFHRLNKKLNITNQIEQTSSFQPKKILLIEEDAIHQKIIMDILKKNGHQVINSHSAEEAINTFKQKHPFDIVLMDLEMSEMDAYTTAGKIRKLEEEFGEHAIVIALKSTFLDEEGEKPISSEVDDYLCKPIKPDHLIKKVEGYS